MIKNLGICLVLLSFSTNLITACKLNDLTPVAGDCSRFYRCSDNILHTVNCPMGLLFDRNAKACNFANQVSCQNAPNTNVPSVLGCNPSQDLTPLAGDCSRFLRCSYNVSYVLNCPSGLLFDVRVRVCNYANQVSCQQLPATTQPTIAPNTCNPSFDLTPFSNCAGFFKCIDNQLYMFNCPNTYLFDPVSKLCQPAHQVNCFINSQATTTTTQATSTTCNTALDLTPAQGCTAFYKCINGQLYLFNCLSGLLFDANTKTCLPANQVTCSQTSTLPTTTNPSSTIPPATACDPALDLTPLPNDCTKFYKCLEGTKLYIFECPSGYAFDSLSRDCQLSNLVTCSSSNNNQTCSNPSLDLTQVPNDCTKFYKCVAGSVYTFTCLDGYLFDSITRGCQLANQAQCASNNQGTSGCDQNKNLTPLPGCTSFYKCVNNVLYTFNCPISFLFDTVSKDCQPANLAVCPGVTNVITPTTAPSITIAPSGCDQTKDLTSASTDCSKFYKCVNNVLYVFNCPTGLIFDSVTKDCQIPSLAVCSSSTNPNIPNTGCDLTKNLTPVTIGDCSRFYKCVNNNLVIFTCPSGFLLDVTIGECNTASLVTNLVRCSSSSTSYKNYEKGVSESAICTANHLVKIDCYNYYYCLKKNLLILACDEDMVFDSKTKECLPKNQVKKPCGNL